MPDAEPRAAVRAVSASPHTASSCSSSHDILGGFFISVCLFTHSRGVTMAMERAGLYHHAVW